MMEVTNLRWVQGEERQEMAVDIDGIETLIPSEQKPTLIQNGYVFLGADFEDKIPEMPFGDLVLKGFVKDDALAEEYVLLCQE
jgi:hypothetical protein